MDTNNEYNKIKKIIKQLNIILTITIILQIILICICIDALYMNNITINTESELDGIIDTSYTEYIDNDTENISNIIIEESAETTPPALYTDEDLEYLTKVMYCEAGSWWITDEQQLLFGSVVLNRVKSVEFPDTVKEVVLQPGQYHPELFDNQTPDERTRNNARKLLEGYDTGMPPSVIFQDTSIQGVIWKAVEIKYLGTTYFCHSPNMWYYD